jgi:hypothetical protein
MSLQMTIGDDYESLVRAQLAQGRAASAQELVERALAEYLAKAAGGFSLGESQRTPAEAVDDIRQLRQQVDLSGIALEDLAHEGHRY